VTDKGIVTEVRPVDPLNAPVPILVTLHIIPLGSVIVLGIIFAPDALELVVTIASVTLVLYKRPLAESRNDVLSVNPMGVLTKYPDNLLISVIDEL